MELRKYQKECIEVLEKPAKKQLIQLPTGSGKTFIFLSYLRKNSTKSLIVVPTLDLQEQIYQDALNFYHRSEIFLNNKDSKHKEISLYILVCNSLKNEKYREIFVNEKLDHIIIDEAHHSASTTYQDFLSFYDSHNINYKLIGFTATPERLDKKSLLPIFESITYKKNIYDLIVEGYLCDLECFRIHTKNTIDSNNKTSDFRLVELQKLDTPSRNSLIYQTYLQNCKNKKTLIFCISIEHAEKIADHLREVKGISAYHICGKQSFSYRKKLLDDFREGKIQILTNCQLLTEGFNEPSIECIIIARPTRSKSLYCQMIGRGTRLHKDKEVCSVYELTDNSHNICTFNVAADENKDGRFIREYKNGIKLTQLHKEISLITMSEFVLEKEKINVLSSFKEFLQSENIYENQKKNIKINPNLLNELNFFEASFLMFIENLKRKYGYNFK